jgi:hypothetical protein
VTPDARGALAEIAARAGVRTRDANMSYRTIRDNFDVRCNFKLDGFVFEVYANPSVLYVKLKIDSGVLFSTPRRNPILNVGLLLGQVAGRDVFVNPQGLGSPVPWIHSPEAVAALSSIEIGDEELLTVEMGGVDAILRSGGVNADWKRLQQLVALARIVPTGAADMLLNPQKVPEDLRDLFPLLARWAISDDVERSDLVSSAKTAALRRLVERTEPRLRRIAEFLGQPGVQDLNEAAALDALAQSVMEARQELTRRSKSSA